MEDDKELYKDTIQRIYGVNYNDFINDIFDNKNNNIKNSELFILFETMEKIQNSDLDISDKEILKKYFVDFFLKEKDLEKIKNSDIIDTTNDERLFNFCFSRNYNHNIIDLSNLVSEFIEKKFNINSKELIEIVENIYKAKDYIENEVNPKIIENEASELSNIILDEFKQAINKGVLDDIIKIKYVCKILEHSLAYIDEDSIGVDFKGFTFSKIGDDFHSKPVKNSIIEVVMDIKENGIDGPYKIPIVYANRDHYQYGVVRENCVLDLENYSSEFDISRIDVKNSYMINKACNEFLGYGEFRDNFYNQINQIFDKFSDGNGKDNFIYKIYVEDPYAPRIVAEKYDYIYDENRPFNEIKTSFDINFDTGEIIKTVNERVGQFSDYKETNKETFVDKEFIFDKEKVKEVDMTGTLLDLSRQTNNPELIENYIKKQLNNGKDNEGFGFLD